MVSQTPVWLSQAATLYLNVGAVALMPMSAG